MIRQRHTRVADARWEQLDESGSHWRVHHGHVDDEDREDPDQRQLLSREDVEHLGEVGEAILGVDLDFDLALFQFRRRIVGVFKRRRQDFRKVLVFGRNRLVVTDLDRRNSAGRRPLSRVIHTSLGQGGLRDIARIDELDGSRRIELERAIGEIGQHGHFRGLLSAVHAGAGDLGHQVEQREQRQCCNCTTSQDDRLTADFVGQ